MAFSLLLCLEGQPPCSRLFTLNIKTVVLRLPFNDAASWGPVRSLFLKLQTVLLGCVRGPPTSLSIAVRDSLRCPLKFLGNFSHGVAFISQNENRENSFRPKFFFGCFDTIIKPTNVDDAPDSQLTHEGQFLCFFNQHNSFQMCLITWLHNDPVMIN